MTALRHLEAEAYVLGAILLDNQALGDVRDLISAHDFTTDFNRQAFGALESLIGGGAAVEELTLARALGMTEQPHLATVYGLTERVPSAATARPYAVQVSTAARLRKLHALCTLIAAEAESTDIAGENEALSFFADAQHRIVEATTFMKGAQLTASEVMRSVIKTAEERAKLGGQIPGITTGFERLDELLLGLRRKHLVVVGARTGAGKTAFALNVMNSAAKAQARTFYASHEMGSDELGLRVLSAESRVAAVRVETGRLDSTDFARLVHSAGEVPPAMLFTDNPPSTMAQLRAECQSIKRRSGLDVVFVDYLQLMSAPVPTANREREIGELSRGLKKLAMDLDLTVVALSQLNRKGDRYGEPTLSELRDSGSIEQDANSVIFLWSDDDESSAIHGKVAKNRGAPIGSFELHFKRAIQKLEESR